MAQLIIHLLTLPLELRHAIYAYACVKQPAMAMGDKEHSETTPTMTIVNGLNIHLLLTCRQIHMEYHKVWSEDLSVTVAIPAQYDDVDFTFLPTFQPQVLKKVARLSLVVSCASWYFDERLLALVEDAGRDVNADVDNIKEIPTRCKSLCWLPVAAL
jgi:hypothetical protein